MKYKKKPVVIEAFRYDGDLKGGWREILCARMGCGSI